MELMKLKGSKFLSNTWKQELTITDVGVESEVLVVGARMKKSLVYNKIAQVNLKTGILTSTLEVLNNGGTNNIVVRAIKKDEAEKAKRLIEQKMLEA